MTSQEPTQGPHPKLEGLEVIRGLAALQVAWGHAVGYDLVDPGPGFSILSQFGSFSVALFFVLSGAIVTHSSQKLATLDPGTAFRRFSWARILRIAPIYYFAIALAFVAAAMLGVLPDTRTFLLHLVFLHSLGGYPALTVTTDSALWSLPYEVAYYAAFALAFFWRGFIICWTGLAFAAVFWLTAFEPELSQATAFAVWILAQSLIWLAGHWSALLARRLKPLPRSLGLALAMLALLVTRAGLATLPALILFALCCCPLIISILQGDARAKRNYWTVRITAATVAVALVWMTSNSFLYAKVGVTAVAAVAGLAPLSWFELSRTLLAPLTKTGVYLGSISYALYAVHMPLFALLGTQARWPWALKLALGFGAAILLAHILERIVQPGLKRALNRQPVAVIP